MKWLWVMTLPPLVAGCVSAPPSGSAICDGLAGDIDKLAAALVVDGGDKSVLAGQHVVAKFDAACAGVKARGE